MDDSIRASVAARAAHRCEYCQIHESDDAFTFHVEHIIAVKHGGSNELNNLAYACQYGKFHKGPNLSGIDPLTGSITSLFHPRQQIWPDHFAAEKFHVDRIIPTGRSTVRVLAMNDPDRVQLRSLLANLQE
jgi:hypothetical protein